MKLPDVGEGVAEAEIVSWLVAVGDEVNPNSVLAEVLTDKATVEVSSPVTGVVAALHGEPGDVLAVGSDLIEIDTGDGDVPADAPAGDGDVPADAPAVDAPVTPEAEAAERGRRARRRRIRAASLQPRTVLDRQRRQRCGPGCRRSAWTWPTCRARGPVDGSSTPISTAS